MIKVSSSTFGSVILPDAFDLTATVGIWMTHKEENENKEETHHEIRISERDVTYIVLSASLFTLIHR